MALTRVRRQVDVDFERRSLTTYTNCIDGRWTPSTPGSPPRSTPEGRLAHWSQVGRGLRPMVHLLRDRRGTTAREGRHDRDVAAGQEGSP